MKEITKNHTKIANQPLEKCTSCGRQLNTNIEKNSWLCDNCAERHTIRESDCLNLRAPNLTKK